MTKSLLRSVCDDLAKRVGGAPDTATQAGQLHNLRVVDEQVDVDTEFADVPVEDFGVGG